MSDHHDGSRERLERLLDGAPPRDDADRETVALLTAIRAAEPPAPDSLRERVAALQVEGARPAPWWGRLVSGPATSSRTPRRRALWIAAPVAAAALAAAVIIPAATRDGGPGQPAASGVAEMAATDSGGAPDAMPAAPTAAPEAASEAAPARAAQAVTGHIRVRVADRSALSAAAVRAVAAVEAAGGRRLAGRMAPRAGERRIVLIVRVPVARLDDAFTALGGLGSVTAERRPDPESIASDTVALRVVFDAPVG